ncbi:MAG: AMP-binding protein [Clostridia bacterium]|nr:AMP-binding protein [Clostridia bacterium]
MINEKDIVRLGNLKPFRDLPTYPDFRSMVNGCADLYREDDAFIVKVKRATKTEPAQYVKHSYLDVKRDVENLALGLIKLGLKDKRVAVTGKNSYEWLITYFAQQSGVGIIVPLDKDLPLEELTFSMKKAEVSAIVFDKEREENVRKAIAEPELKDVKMIAVNETEGAVSFYDVIRMGESATVEERNALLATPIDGNALSIILFTSGTSGLAKAVMLTQQNVISNCKDAADCEDIRRGDRNIAFLPYHHTLGATGQLALFTVGSPTVYCDGLKYIQQNLKEYEVAVFICVPLIIESIYKKIMATIEKQGKMATFKKGMKISNFLMKFGIDIRRKLFKDIHEQLGGHIRYVISGASPLDPVVAEVYPAIGINVVQGYGMTETAPILAVEGLGQTEAGTVGYALPRTEVAILNPDKDGVGEVIGRGPGVMLGYYNDPVETAKILEEDGWIHTGDLGMISEDKHMLKICGRSKNVIVLKNGKNVYPEELETLVANLPYVKECMVYGEEKTGRNNVDDMVIVLRLVYDSESFPGKDISEIQKEVDSDIEKINATMPAYKRIFRTYLTTVEMEKTTTGKVKRYKQVK